MEKANDFAFPQLRLSNRSRIRAAEQQEQSPDPPWPFVARLSRVESVTPRALPETADFNSALAGLHYRPLGRGPVRTRPGCNTVRLPIRRCPRRRTTSTTVAGRLRRTRAGNRIKILCILA